MSGSYPDKAACIWNLSSWDYSSNLNIDMPKRNWHHVTTTEMIYWLTENHLSLWIKEKMSSILSASSENIRLSECLIMTDVKGTLFSYRQFTQEAALLLIIDWTKWNWFKTQSSFVGSVITVFLNHSCHLRLLCFCRIWACVCNVNT